ncbi:MAG TPA: glycosyltransferase family 4 protein [Blastocatellia bacterium]|nr:glycosyltransferase family 4 protein [Blastocatellia bacterium]
MSVLKEAVDEMVAAPPGALRIVLSHPHGNTNSYHAARALAEESWLHTFQTGVLGDSAASRLFSLFSSDIKHRAPGRSYRGIPAAGQESHVVWEAVSQLGKRVKPGGPTARVNWYDVLFWGHDLQVSRSLSGDLDAIYAYEDGAMKTFAAAKKKEIATVYELPLGYYRGVAREINRARSEHARLQPTDYAEPSWKQARKDEELRLADTVIVPCAWALDSLRFSDVGGAKPAIKIPYGTPSDEVASRTARPDGPFTVLFAGQVGLRKGVPHLIEAWERLRLKDARLLFAGSLSLPKEYLREKAGSFEYLGALPRAELFERMRQADLFAFPSLAEGFGLVIGEAMACGVPVLTTTNTGGPELITDGREGWCVAAHSTDTLAERLEWAYQNRDRLFEMGNLARLRAEQWTWKDYRRKLVRELAPYLQ